MKRFAERLGTKLFGIIPHDEDVFMAPHVGGRSFDEAEDGSDYVRACREVFEGVRAVRTEDRVVPTPLSDKELGPPLRAGHGRHRVSGLDHELRQFRARLETRGFRVRGLTVSEDGGLRVRCQRPDIAFALESASATPPAGQAVSLGGLRLVVAGAALRSQSTARKLFAALSRLLSDELEGPLGRWLAPSLHRTLAVERSPAGLRRVLSARLGAKGALWASWRVSVPADGAGVGLPLQLSDDSDQRLDYVLDGAPDEGDVIAETALGALRRQASSAGPDAPRAAERVLRLVLLRSLGGGAHWVAPLAVPEGDEDAAGDLPAPTTGSLLDLCLGAGLTDERSHEPLLSDFFAARGHADAYRQTLFAQEIAEGAAVVHAGGDCHMVTSTFAPRWESGFRRWSGRYPRTAPRPTRIYVTGMDDLSVATGGEARLDEVLEHAAAAHAGERLRVFSSCDYHMIGDNVEGVCQARELGCPATLDLEPPHVSAFEGLSAPDPWERFLDTCAPAPLPREDERPSVNLVGYEGFGHPDLAHLGELLADLGVAVEAVLLPGLSPGAAASFRRARLTLRSSGEPVGQLFATALEERGLPHLAPPLPYGEAATFAWLESVTSALGLSGPDEAAKRRWLRDLSEPLARARARAAGLRAALVFDAGPVQELVSPRFFHGVDPVAMLLDTGVSLSLVSVPRFPLDAPHDPALLAKLAGQGVRFVAGEVGRDAEALLREENFDIVYCEVDDGALVKRAGAVPLDIRALRMGLGGALHNARQVAAAAEFSLYRRYRGYLSPRPMTRSDA